MKLHVTHTPGRHCASSGIKDLVRYHGLSWSEAVCFGIGAGLGIWYLKGANISPSRLVHVRSADIETQFFTRIGCPFKWERFEGQVRESEEALCRHLEEQQPALLQTDIYYLPYYGSRTHFPGHVIVVWGYNPELRVFYVTDTERTEIQQVAFKAMRQARFSGGGFFDVKGNMFAPAHIDEPGNLAQVMRNAILHNSRTLLASTDGMQGLSALRQWQQELPLWQEFEDWQWTARFAYQVIEKRGTGGGGFRLLYADFLQEAAHLVPEIAALGLPATMRQAAAAWRDLALALYHISEQSSPDFSGLYHHLSHVIQLESTYHKQAMSLA